MSRGGKSSWSKKNSRRWATWSDIGAGRISLGRLANPSNHHCSGLGQLNERFKRSDDQTRLDDGDVVLAERNARGSLLGKVTPNEVNLWMRRPRMNVGTIRIAAGRSGRVPMGGKIHGLQLSVVTGITPSICAGRVQFVDRQENFLILRTQNYPNRSMAAYLHVRLHTRAPSLATPR